MAARYAVSWIEPPAVADVTVGTRTRSVNVPPTGVHGSCATSSNGAPPPAVGDVPAAPAFGAPATTVALDATRHAMSIGTARPRVQLRIDAARFTGRARAR